MNNIDITKNKMRNKLVYDSGEINPPFLWFGEQKDHDIPSILLDMCKTTQDIEKLFSFKKDIYMIRHKELKYNNDKDTFPTEIEAVSFKNYIIYFLGETPNEKFKNSTYSTMENYVFKKNVEKWYLSNVYNFNCPLKLEKLLSDLNSEIVEDKYTKEVNDLINDFFVEHEDEALEHNNFLKKLSADNLDEIKDDNSEHADLIGLLMVYSENINLQRANINSNKGRKPSL